MTLYDDSKPPYNNPYNADKRYSKILFYPGRNAFNWEMLEMQSMQNHQMELLGDSLFQEGAIISGMDIVPKVTNFNNNSTLPSGVNANNFSQSSLSSVSATLNTSTYLSQGVISVVSASQVSSDYPGLSFSSVVTKGLSTTISFSLKKTSGTLNNLGLVYDNTKVSLSNYTIDGTSIGTTLPNGVPTSDTSGKTINLNDGTSHKVVATFTTRVSGLVSFSLLGNYGYNALTVGQVGFSISSLKTEDGTSATAWVLSFADSNNTERSKTYTVNDGTIWLQGAVRDFVQQDITLTGTGTENIGVTVNESLITADQDSSLIDHTTASDGSLTTGKVGANRVQYTVNLTYNDDSSIPIYTFVDNQLSTSSSKPTYSAINKILAKRTADESGSYVVSGFNGTTSPDPLDSTKIRLNIDAGTAYVNGYQVITSTTTPVSLDKSVTSSGSTSEQYVYQPSYQLVNQPVQQVNKVVASVQGTNQNVVRSSSGITDTFASTTEVYQIVSVVQGSTTYTQGKDFSFSANVITWGRDSNGKSLSGAKVPSAGSSYTVVYNYTAVLTEGTDYKLVVDDSQNTSISFTGMSGLTPISNSLVNVDYSFFYARMDMITIKNPSSSDNNPFTVIKGSPNSLSSVKPPVLDDAYSLELGYVTILPNSDKAIFVMDTVKNMPFSELQKRATQVDNLQYNSAISSATQAATSTVNPLTYKDVFADNFVSLDVADTSNKDFTAAYDFSDGYIVPSIRSSVSYTPTIDSTSSTTRTTGSFVTANYTETNTISQTSVTDTINVNPYDVYSINGSLSLSPAVDNWVDQQHTTIYNKKVQKSVSTIGNYNASNYLNSLGLNIDNAHLSYGNFDANNAEIVGNVNHFWDSERSNAWGKYTIDTTKEIGSKTINSAIQFMRQTEVAFDATNLLPDADNLQVTIDDVPVDTPKAATASYQGTQEGTFKADSNGEVKGTFKIPIGIQCGSRNVKIANGDNMAFTSYTAYGTTEDIQKIVNKVAVTVYLYDPVAQSFTLSDNKYLTSIGMYFYRTPSTNNATAHPSISVQVRTLNSDGSGPSNEVLGTATIASDTIKTSNDASAETRVYFDDLIPLNANQGYCFVVVTDSDNYWLYKATKGKHLLGDESTYLTGRPSDNGNLFTSSNAQSWVDDPSSSLKYNVYTASFNTEASLVFTPNTLSSLTFTDGDTTITPDKINRMALLTAYTTAGNTNIDWYVRYLMSSDDASAKLSDRNWLPMNAVNGVSNSSINESGNSPYSGQLNFEGNVRQVQLMAKMSATSNVSPKISLDALHLVGIVDNTSATYLSENVNESDDAAFNTLKAQINAHVPTSGNIDLQYSVDGGNTWKTFSNNGTSPSVPTSIKAVNPMDNQYTFVGKVPGSSLATQVKYKVSIKGPDQYHKPQAGSFTVVLTNE